MNDKEALKVLSESIHKICPTKNMELCESIVLSVGKGEPLDFATMNFTNKKVRENYRKAENFAKNYLLTQSTQGKKS